MTVGELIVLLEAFDKSLPVLVDGYEWGYQYPAAPKQIIAECRPCSACAGDWDEPDNMNWGDITEPAQPVVLIERGARD